MMVFPIFAVAAALVVVVLGFALISGTVKILRQYERAVVFTLGKFSRVRGPGLVLLVPFVQEMVRVDLRIQVIEIPSQDVISRDNVSMKVDAVLYFNVANPEHAVIQVQNYLPATNMLAQTTLRAVLGQHDLDEMISERKKLSADVQSILDAQNPDHGVDRQHGSRNRQAGRGGARQASQDHSRRGRVPGLADFGQCREDPGQHTRGDAVALSANPDGNRRRAEFDHRFPDADRCHAALPGYTGEGGQDRSGEWRRAGAAGSGGACLRQQACLI
jgi:hypothetical protein